MFIEGVADPAYRGKSNLNATITIDGRSIGIFRKAPDAPQDIYLHGQIFGFPGLSAGRLHSLTIELEEESTLLVSLGRMTHFRVDALPQLDNFEIFATGVCVGALFGNPCLSPGPLHSCPRSEDHCTSSSDGESVYSVAQTRFNKPPQLSPSPDCT